MDDTKDWWTSKTIWASFVQIAAGLAATFGLFNSAAVQEIVTAAPELIVGTIGVATGAFALYGRVTATKTIV